MKVLDRQVLDRGGPSHVQVSYNHLPTRPLVLEYQEEALCTCIAQFELRLRIGPFDKRQNYYFLSLKNSIMILINFLQITMTHLEPLKMVNVPKSCSYSPSWPFLI